ncbi:MAG: ChuX/HutX family heme-like substrate-binding protein [Thiobacillus sp.]|nr:ChuX/HutX family heme-like substrate-binding protein [Thiobacillus sp.]
MSAVFPAAFSSFTPKSLRDAWHALTAEKRLRIRDAAHTLGVSEAELLATGVGEHVTRLAGDLRGLMLRIGELGSVTALTRNEAAVHDKEGAYQNINHGDQVGLVLGDAIDLRLFYDKWAFGYAVEERIGQDTRRSFQFFDACGDAVHKIYLRDGADLLTFEALRDAWAAPIQIPGETVLPRPAGRTPERADDGIDIKALRTDWQSMADTNQFFGLLKRHKISRTQAFRLIGNEFATPLLTNTPARLLQSAATTRQEIMVYVGSPGCIQIHTGPVKNIHRMGNWLNVLDHGFSLHLREDRVAQAWLVKKPTADGIVTSVELFDAAGEFIAYFFGQRKPGLPETTGWRMLAESLEPR